MNARFPGSTGHGHAQSSAFIEWDYIILDTDYDNYAVVYECTNWFFGIMHTQHAWLLNRKTNDERFNEWSDIYKDVLTTKVPHYDFEKYNLF